MLTAQIVRRTVVEYSTSESSEKEWDMRIAILGAGNVGGAVATAAVRAGHDVVVAATSAEHAQKAAGSAGASAAASNAEAVQGADLVLLAVPHAAVAGIATELGEALTGKVLVDVTNPLNDTYSDLVTGGVSAAEQLQAQVTGASVVKAFNTILASRHSNPVESGAPLDAFIAGDDGAAKDKVAELASSLGYRVIDAGGLRMARSLEEMALLNIMLNARNGWSWQSGWKLVGPVGGAA
ncbi:NADPH-dependent F420 reductase [Micromonospora sp. NPDC052213]|uniref:NADPH-dependent F420 reductase n=1 Tax=Micromonospora sp. NPDC052213 TaxID=3155812 RepID=UPI00343B2637